MREEAINIMKSFVSGNMTVEDFWIEFNANPLIEAIIVEQEIKAWGSRYTEWWASATTLKAYVKDINKYRFSDMVFMSVKFFFENSNIPCSIDNFYRDRYSFLIKIQPDWLDLDDEDYLIDNIINKIPNDLTSQTKKIKWCKEEIKKHFKYDKTPPRWVQSAEWPIIDGKPLVFKKQSKEKLDDERVHFYFYNPETGEETTVTQFF